MRERRIYINVPMAVLVPFTATFTNQKAKAELRCTGITLQRGGEDRGEGRERDNKIEPTNKKLWAYVYSY